MNFFPRRNLHSCLFTIFAPSMRLLFSACFVAVFLVTIWLFWSNFERSRPHYSTELGWCSSDELAINPLDVSHPRKHDEAFGRFKRWCGSFEKDYVIDWLGVRTKLEFDCLGDPLKLGYNYFISVPSRRSDCEWHERMKGTTELAAGRLPMLDEEYAEWIDMLRAVLATKEEEFVVVELGARYGTWGARAMAAWMNLYGSSKKKKFVGVELLPQYTKLMKEHLEVNGMLQDSVLLTGAANFPGGDGVYSLKRIMEECKLGHINYLDLDIQEYEWPFLNNSETIELLEKHVDRVHIGTHSKKIHADLKVLFAERKWGWAVEEDFDFGITPQCEKSLVNAIQTDKSCIIQTRFGPVYQRDGLLSLKNMKRAAGEPTKQFSPHTNGP